jgi:choice-of-anchor A domain-containing protein
MGPPPESVESMNYSRCWNDRVVIALRISLAAILLAFLPAARANNVLSLSAASGYNVFVFSAYSTPGGTDIEGSVAVGGNFTATGSLGINETPGGAAPGTPGLVVGGNLSLAGGQLDNGNAGDATVGGSVSSSSYFTFQHNLNYGTLNNSNIVVDGAKTQITPPQSAIAFVSAATSLTQLSSVLTSMAANGTVTVNGPNYTLTASGCSLCVFNLTNGNFSGGAISINAPTGATVVINVAGTSDSLSNGSISYTGGATASDTIFNFGSATSLSTSSITVYGSILAPLATFTGTNGSIDGELIANSVTGETAEFESGDIFNGNLGSIATSSPVSASPEPSTWALMATALLAIAALRLRAHRALSLV